MKQSKEDKFKKVIEKFATANVPYTKEFWKKVREQIKKEHERYEETCRRLKIDWKVIEQCSKLMEIAKFIGLKKTPTSKNLT